MTQRADYDQLAKRYDEDRADWLRPPSSVVPLLLQRFATVRALDCGCGTGSNIAAQPQDDRVRWLGLEPSSAMLAVARSKLPATTLLRGLADHIPLADASLHHVYMSYVLHHFPDKPAAFAEFARVLAPDGVLQIVNGHPWSYPSLWIYEFFPETWDLDCRRYLRQEAIAELLDAIGFDVTIDNSSHLAPIAATYALAAAERRVDSPLVVVDDVSYARGLERLRGRVREQPDSTVEGAAGVMTVTATRR